MGRIPVTAIALVGLIACTSPATAGQTLAEARQGFQTKLTREVSTDDALPEPPNSSFEVVSYPGPLGPMKALLAYPEPHAAKMPAVVWITGGFPSGGIGTSAWVPQDRGNDQSAKAFRERGSLMLYVTLRGSYGNPGQQESFLGEVDDVLAAVDYVRGLDGVDPDRVYLGGHSTGGTLALLVAAGAETPFAGVLALGPVSSPANYGADVLTFDPSKKRERALRSPIEFLDGIASPTFVIEGATASNADHVEAMQAKTRNPKLRFMVVEGANHFDVIAPVVDLLARRTAEGGFLAEPSEVQAAYEEMKRATRDADDLDRLSAVRYSGVSLVDEVQVEFYFVAEERAPLAALAGSAATTGFAAGPLTAERNSRGEAFHLQILTRSMVLGDLPALFATTAKAEALADGEQVFYSGWSVEE